MTIYQVEVRRHPDDASADDLGWRRFERRAFDADEDLVLTEGFEVGGAYYVRVRAVDEQHGGFSDWVVYDSVTVERPAGAPPAPTDLRVSGGCLTWSMPHVVEDLAGFEVRHAPGNETSFDRAQPLHDGLVDPPMPLCTVPQGDRTMLVRAVDLDGNTSPATTLRTNRGAFDDSHEFTLREHDLAALGWPGWRQGCTLISGVLRAEEAALTAAASPAWLSGLEPAWSAHPSFPAWDADDAPAWGKHWGGKAPAWKRAPSAAAWAIPYRWAEYCAQFEVLAGETGPDVILSVDLATDARQWRLQYRRRNAAPAWSGEPRMPYWTSGSTAAWTAAPTPFRPWPGKVTSPRAGIYDFRLLVPAGFVTWDVTRMTLRLTAARREEIVQGVSVPTSSTRAVPTLPFRRLLEVRPRFVGADATIRPVQLDGNRTKGPRVQLVTTGDAATSGALDVVLVGHGFAE